MSTNTRASKNSSNRPIRKRATSTSPRSPALAARRWEARPWLGTSRSRSKSLCWLPGYGVADVVLQGLGGWLGFGLHDFLHTKSNVQDGLVLMEPRLAAVGRRLSASPPGARRAATGAPVFRTGCGSSDVLHDLMQLIAIKCVVGHSK